MPEKQEYYFTDFTEEQAKELLDELGKVWSKFIKYTHSPINGHKKVKVHDDDVLDFRKGIHDLQRIVATIRLRHEKPELFR